MTTRRLLFLNLVAAVLTIASFTVAIPASAGSHSARAERERVRREKAQVAAEMNVLRAENDEVDRALAALNSHVAAQQSQAKAAEQAAAAAERELADARAAEAEIGERIGVLRTDLKDMAISAYISGASLDDDIAASGGDFSDAARREALADLVLGSGAELRDQLQAAEEDLQLARAAAETARDAAEQRRKQTVDRLRDLQAARDQQAAFAAKVDARIEARLAEAASLARLDQQLSSRIQREESALAARNGGGRGTRVAPVPRGGNVPLRNVRGIYVHADIADELESLMAAAEADGIPLSGGGYRNSDDQRRARQANCPDPERSPASSCRPPTARPGQSMHERGLAVDFTYGGRIISSRSSPAFRWLDQNASRFGFYNLPGEPWHWSTNGN